MSTDILKERTASIFKVEKLAEKETIKRQVENSPRKVLPPSSGSNSVTI
jgi:hypothetical protein